jgi:prevent-host-death family protein
MTTHSIADAKDQLLQLIDRALQGEPIVITRHGEPVVELKPVRPAPQPVPRAITAADIEWLRAKRAQLPYCEIDASTFISYMRDEEEHGPLGVDSGNNSAL